VVHSLDLEVQTGESVGAERVLKSEDRGGAGDSQPSTKTAATDTRADDRTTAQSLITNSLEPPTEGHEDDPSPQKPEESE
jgi:hypothetical protein